MKNLNFVLICFLFLVGGTVFGQNTSGGDYSEYKDQKYPFFISYPKTWKSVEVSHPQIRLEVISNNGKGTANFNISVTEVKGSEKVPSSTYVKLFLNDNPELITALAEKLLPGSKIPARGKTYLSNKEAFYFIYEGKYKVLDETYDFKGYQLQMLYEGRLYTLSFGCSKEEFDRQFSTFQEIAVSLGVLSTTIIIPENNKTTPRNVKKRTK